MRGFMDNAFSFGMVTGMAIIIGVVILSFFLRDRQAYIYKFENTGYHVEYKNQIYRMVPIPAEIGEAVDTSYNSERR